MNQDNLKLVGDFLRTKRKSISPETIGLTKPPRARTEGLRRDDVAYLSGISTVWYSKIERGQVTGISPQVLTSISKTLRLTRSECEYLSNLISSQSTIPKDPCTIISEHTSQLLLQLNPLPSLLMNDYLDIVAYNHAFSIMVGFSVDSIPVTEKNYLYLTIRNSAWKKLLLVDDEDKLELLITRIAGVLRDTLARRPDDEILKQRIDSFRKLSHIFDKAWTDNIVLQPEEKLRMYTHAELGEISLDKQLWWNFSDNTSSRLHIYYPQNEVDRLRLFEIMQSHAE